MNTHEHYYQALISRDPRFDGAFFVGVSSTGVYCRPVCRVRTPKPENCHFYASAALAEAAGYRPCLRCRPELSPVHTWHDTRGQAIIAAIETVELAGHGGCDLTSVAKHLDLSTRHLNRLALDHLGVPLTRFLQTRRLLKAKKLLTETHLSITEIAFLCGFGSLRSLHHHFQKAYRLTPTAIRKSAQRKKPSTDNILSLMLSYRPPYDWHGLIQFLGNRTIAKVEHVHEGVYYRTVQIHYQSAIHQGWLAVKPHPTINNALNIDISERLSGALPLILYRLQHQFDLHADPMSINQTLGELASSHQGVRLPGAFDGFEMAIRAILGQQITVKAAHTLAGRFAEAFGEKIDTPFENLSVLFPSPQTVASLSKDEITSLGIIGKRADTIITLAKAIAEGNLDLSPTAAPEMTIQSLVCLPGIGDWTAHYIAMRALHWPDAFPHKDLGIMKALNETHPKTLLATAEQWRPWRAYAVMHLWKRLENSL